MNKKKTTKKPREIPDSYQFTTEDIQWYWNNFSKCCSKDGPSPESTKAELSFFHLVNEASRISTIIKHLPTMRELRECWRQEDEEQARKRAKLHEDWAAREVLKKTA
jgi:hypothetical protein